MIRHLLTLTVALSFVSSLAAAALSPSDKQSIPYENRAASVNSGFENAISKWVSSPAITLASATPQAGSKYAQWDSTSAAQTLTLGSIGRPDGQLEVSCAVRVPSGTATHTFSVVESSGSTTVASMSIENSTTWRYQTLTFPSPSAGTLSIVFTSVAADEPSIDIDDCYVGRARNVGSTQLISEWQSYTPVFVGLGTVTISEAFWRQDGDSIWLRGRATLGTTTGATATMSLPGALTISSTKATITTNYGTMQNNSATKDFQVLATGGNTTVSFSDSSSSGLASAIGTAVGSSGQAFGWIVGPIPIQGWTAQSLVMPDAQGWYVDATIAGANIDLGTSNVASYSEMSTGSLTMTPRTGSAAAGIMCNSTNAAATPTTSTSTCSVGSESVGINASIPRSGAYEVCASFSHYTEADQGEGVNTAFQLVRTATNAQTILEEGGSRTSSRNAPLAIASGTAQAMNFPYNTCGIFQLSAGVNGFRLMYEQLVTGTPNGSQVLADALSTVGQRDVRFTIKPVSQQQQAILANSVSSASTNGTHFNSAQVGSTGTVSKETGDWISGSCSVASAVYTCTLVAGAFSTDPACHATIFGETTSYNAVVTSASTSSVVVRTFDTANAAADAAFGLTCSGPR